MPSVFAALLAILLSTAVSAEALRIQATPVPLKAGDPSVKRVGRLVYQGGLLLRSRHRRFGGLSGLHVSADGKRLLAISDIGRWVEARLRYDRAGRLIGLAHAHIGRLRRPDGGLLSWRERDSETLAMLSGGRLAVGFEGTPRIWIYPPSKSPFARRPTAIAVPEGLRFASRNAGLEALAALAGGGLLALAEDMAAPAPHGYGAHAGWLRAKGRWTALAYDRVGVYRPTGAARLPTGTKHAGDVVVIERALYLFAGFSIRVMLMPAHAIKAGARMRPKHLATLAAPLTVDNFEGVAARRGANGETLIYLVSDDNFRAGQRTYLMMFRLTD
ncbi:MAG: esterase-like activity of phytase family protein [Alphaproteobacteria bacterium]|nr:esterase-like activity of phytase family protein [Alphaproteobacteria bacterium]